MNAASWLVLATGIWPIVTYGKNWQSPIVAWYHCLPRNHLRQVQNHRLSPHPWWCKKVKTLHKEVRWIFVAGENYLYNTKWSTYQPTPPPLCRLTQVAPRNESPMTFCTAISWKIPDRFTLIKKTLIDNVYSQIQFAIKHSLPAQRLDPSKIFDVSRKGLKQKAQ